MPYRSELKRPDLKGQFPCSVCGKIFCHSSSLSRHRMQAHFKSYQCMQCNQEISSNETLRTHMIKTHQIARMFMCRCCNWAFPDKTSLHLHTTSLSKTGKPGEVAVLARSFAEGDELYVPDNMRNTPSSSPPDARDSISPEHKPHFDPPTMGVMPQPYSVNPLMTNPIMGAFLNQMNLLKNSREKLSEMPAVDELLKRNNQYRENNPDLNTSTQVQILSNMFQQFQKRKRTMSPEAGPRSKKDHVESPSLANFSVSGCMLQQSLSPSSSDSERKNKRKSRKPQQLQLPAVIDPPGLSNLDLYASPSIRTEYEEDNKHSESDSEPNQLSPPVSDSHTSGSNHETPGHPDLSKNGEDKADYAEKFAHIGQMVEKFIEMIKDDKIAKEKDRVIDLAFKIREQCSDA